MRRDAGAFSAMRNYLKGDRHLIQKKVREINKGLHGTSELEYVQGDIHINTFKLGLKESTILEDIVVEDGVVYGFFGRTKKTLNMRGVRDIIKSHNVRLDMENRKQKRDEAIKHARMLRRAVTFDTGKIAPNQERDNLIISWSGSVVNMILTCNEDVEIEELYPYIYSAKRDSFLGIEMGKEIRYKKRQRIHRSGGQKITVSFHPKGRGFETVIEYPNGRKKTLDYLIRRDQFLDLFDEHCV